jgi:hypothetical protein
MRFRSTRTPGTGSGFRPAILFLLVAIPGLPLLHGQSAPIPALTGVANNASVDSGLTVDGRHILLSKDTDYSCSTVSGSFTVQSGVPVFPPGSSVAVFGKWDKKAEAYRASAVCLQKMPEKTVSGAGFIDAVKPGPADSTLVYADGRALTLPNPAAPIPTGGAGQPVLTMAPPLNAGAPPVVGEWLQYHAERSSDGSLLITQGVVHEKLKTRMSDNFRTFKPATFVIPTTGALGN